MLGGGCERGADLHWPQGSVAAAVARPLLTQREETALQPRAMGATWETGGSGMLYSPRLVLMTAVRRRRNQVRSDPRSNCLGLGGEKVGGICEAQPTGRMLKK